MNDKNSESEFKIKIGKRYYIRNNAFTWYFISLTIGTQFQMKIIKII